MENHKSTNQKNVEQRVQSYINSLKNCRSQIESLQGKNTSFLEIQKSLLATFDNCIVEAENRIEEVNNGAIWDNLVIAFFGETNAGKSTIIETFRILFGEEERNHGMQENKDGVDGLIVGDGHSDFTKVYKEYNLTISGKPFTLIDVPGIEGNEQDYEEEIKMALNKAHYVFYVQGQNKKPDSGTANKIKKYLREWVKVYSVYNVRGVASNYDEEIERVSLVTEKQYKIEQQICDTFTELLGSTYEGNLTLQAYLAMCSNAIFAPARVDLQKQQKKLLSYFGNSKNMFEFSQFSSLTNVVEDKTKNFAEEILEANKEKNKALLHKMFEVIRDTTTNQDEAINRFVSDIKSFEADIKKDFSSTKGRIKSYASQQYEAIFGDVYFELAKAIDDDHSDLEKYCKNRTRSIVNLKTVDIENYIQTEIEELNRKIQKRKKSLDQSLSSISMYSGIEVNIEMNLSDALGKLDTSFSDICNVAIGLGGAIWAGVAAANLWNPFGWIVGVFGVASWLFGSGRDKKAEAKEEMKKSVEKARCENKVQLDSLIASITNKLQSKCRSLCSAIETDLKGLNEMQSEISTMQNTIKSEYSKLNSSSYGQL